MRTIIFSIIGGLILAGIFLVLSLGKTSKNINTVNEKNTQPTLTQNLRMTDSKFKNYTDEAGFKFSYPENLKVNAINSSNQKIYSQLNLGSNDIKGQINLIVEDTILASLDSWLKSNKISTGESEIDDVKLADLKGLEIKTKNKILTAALDKNVLFTIEVELKENKDYWSDVYQKLLASFAFVTPSVAPASNSNETDTSSGEEDVTFEGEEVVE